LPDAASRRPVQPLVELARRSGDASPEDQGGYWFPPDPYGVSTPFGWSSSAPHPGRSRGSAPHALSCSFEDVSSQPRIAASRPGPEGPRSTRPAMLPLLGFRALRHDLGPADPLSLAVDPSTTACHVRGLSTSFAASTTDPPGARGAGASMGFALQGVPLVRERRSSRSPCPPDVAGQLSPSRGRKNRAAAFRALFPRRVRAVTGIPKETGRRCLLELHPSRVFSPSARAIACSRDAGPHVLGGDDVPTHLDPRASRIEWIGLVRFRTAYSLEVSHLATVTSLRSSSRGAGSWFHLTQEATPCGATTTAI
jgi:hypothetical protein